MRALNRKVLRDFFLLRAQVTTTAILVICGVALLISSWSAFNSLRDSRDRYYRDYAFADLFSNLKRAPLEVVPRLQAIPGVEQVDPRIVMDGLVDVRGSEPAVGRFVSVPSGKEPKLNRLYLRKGRLPADGPETEVAVHEGFARANDLRIGDTLTVTIQGSREKVKIVGIALSPEYVYALSPAAPLPDDRHFGVLWMPRRDLDRLARMKGAFNNVCASVGPSGLASLGAIKSSMDAILKPYGSRGAYDRERQASNRFVDDEIAEQKGSAIVTPAIFLSIAAFLIHIISSRLIAMHRSQIATLKAVGYRNAEVSLHYAKLIILMMLSGAIPGIALGAYLGHLVSKTYEGFFHFPKLDFSLSLTASIIGLAAGLLPGIIGAWTSIRSAFRLPPAEAMRPPAPPSFHASVLEKSGVQEHLTIRGRMILRNLFFRPLRLFLSVAGMSTALAVMVTSSAWNDIVRFLLDTQFQRSQREDLSITFVHPLPEGVLQEITDMKGVLDVEGYRVEPIRIRYRNFKRELSLVGWPRHAQMRQRLDWDLKPIPLPHDGILLSRFFRDKWGLRPGDTVRIETLEGRTKKLNVVVGGFTDDMIGIGASMEIGSLWRLLGEEPGFNLATLKIDPRNAHQIYVRLKGYPNVATVNLKEALYRGFQQSFGAMIRVTTAILIGFALAIAIGVIYNSVRVSFSERAWEMASLRVFGYSAGDTFRMLLAEAGTQVVLSLAPGCLLGLGLTYFVLKGVNTETLGFPIVIETSTYAKGILVVGAAFLFSALAVRRMILKLSLTEALKSSE